MRYQDEITSTTIIKTQILKCIGEKGDIIYYEKDIDVKGIYYAFLLNVPYSIFTQCVEITSYNGLLIKAEYADDLNQGMIRFSLKI